MIIQKANLADAQALTNLTIRSKAFWGYPVAQLRLWKDDLTITPQYIEEAHVYKLMEREELFGYYSYVQFEDNKIKLDNIFIKPAYIGDGYGRFMMNHLIQVAVEDGYVGIILDSDPHAEQFYSKFGFKVIGQKETSIEDRFLPIMELIL